VAARTTTRMDRTSVIEAACVLADKEGFGNLSLASLSASLGRHASSLYNHVDGLDGLRRDVTIQALRELSEELRAAVLGRGGPAGLRAIAGVYRSFAEQKPGRFEALSTWRHRTDVPDKEITSAFLPGVDAIHAVMTSFGLEGDGVDFATRAFVSAIVGFVQISVGAFYGPPSSDDTYEHLISLFETALSEGTWPGP
jgi:AcrR family transcriptional regulator